MVKILIFGFLALPVFAGPVRLQMHFNDRPNFLGNGELTCKAARANQELAALKNCYDRGYDGCKLETPLKSNVVNDGCVSHPVVIAKQSRPKNSQVLLKESVVEVGTLSCFNPFESCKGARKDFVNEMLADCRHDFNRCEEKYSSSSDAQINRHVECTKTCSLKALIVGYGAKIHIQGLGEPDLEKPIITNPEARARERAVQ